MRGRTCRLVVATIAALAIVVAAGVAWATIPDGSGVIHSCFKKQGGALRLIDPGAGGNCGSSENTLSWTQTGPGGVQGVQGIQGPQGDQGVQGKQGPPGVGVSDYQVITALGTTATQGNDAYGTASADCPDGTRVVGGGFSLPSTQNLSVEESSASLSQFGDSWTVTAWGDAGWVFVAYAVCVNQQAITGS